AFGIHFFTALELLRHRHPDDPDGFHKTLRSIFYRVGPGVGTGALTTAAAFMTTMLTDFRGVAEMGLIAGVGVLLCLVAMFTVLPALTRLVRPGHQHVVQVHQRRIHLFRHSWVRPFCRFPRLTLAAAAIVGMISGVAITQMTFDYNLTNLQAVDAPSLQWQRRVGRDGGQSVWFAVSVAPDLETARQLAERYQALPDVGEVGGVGLLFPPDGERKREAMRAAREELGTALDEALAPAPLPDESPPLLPKLTALKNLLGVARWVSDEKTGAALDRLLASIERARGVLLGLPDGERADRRAAVNQAYRRWRKETAETIHTAIDPAPMTPEDMPGPIIDPFIADDGPLVGQLAIQVYPRLPEGEHDPPIDSALDSRFLPGFVERVVDVDPEATGPVVQIYRSGIMMQRAYSNAGMYALVVVLLLVWFDFRRLHDAVLSLVPVALGFVMTFAAMWLAGLPLNPANIMVLPLMFGIGVDAGVHVIHRYRQNPRATPPGLTHGTGKGITVTSLTTVIGFGALVLASHRGISNLGLVLSVGVLLTLFSCWMVMPAWLTLRHQARSDDSAAGAEEVA
ncbi:MAG: MMPL family transporter, partial [Phycisphaeraceae bacterium]|nr:MMPL family transporter [Phycisphaeraceae bacterium]